VNEEERREEEKWKRVMRVLGVGLLVLVNEEEEEEGGEKKAKKQKRVRRVLGVSLLVIVLVVLAGMLWVGYLSLRPYWRPTPVAEAFTRVGGPTRVKTAVEASRFWFKPPALVVITPANASQPTMFAAARCAMAHDAPLLFSSRPKQPGLVDTTIDHWQNQATGPVQTEMVRNPGDVHGCLAIGHRVNVHGLSILKVPHQPPRPPYVAAQNRLAPVVVFAAARAPGDPPDVAVGLALAAHLALGAHTSKPTTGPKVSLVVVPRYLESDPQLEQQLQDQHAVVQGGVVLGSTRILSEDTHALLRRLLTATDQQGFLAQLQNNLGLIGSLLVGLLGVVGLGTAAAVGTRAAIRKSSDIAQRTGPITPPPWIPKTNKSARGEKDQREGAEASPHKEGPSEGLGWLDRTLRWLYTYERSRAAP
jgi:hypothetical protein